MAAAAAAEGARRSAAARQASEAVVAEAVKWASAAEVAADVVSPSTVAAAAAALAPDAVNEAATLGSSALQSSQQQQQQLDLPPAAALPATVVPLLTLEWTALESVYTAGMCRSFAGMRAVRRAVLSHVAESLASFAALLRRPADAKDALLSQFITRFNAVEPDMRRSKETMVRFVAQTLLQFI